MSSKKSIAASYEVIIREDRENTHHFLLIAAKDVTITARTSLPVSMIDNIPPFLPLCDLFIFMTPIKFCQESLTHELMVKAAIIYFRKITTEHANCVTTIN